MQMELVSQLWYIGAVRTTKRSMKSILAVGLMLRKKVGDAVKEVGAIRNNLRKPRKM